MFFLEVGFPFYVATVATLRSSFSFLFVISYRLSFTVAARSQKRDGLSLFVPPSIQGAFFFEGGQRGAAARRRPLHLGKLCFPTNRVIKNIEGTTLSWLKKAPLHL
ncbi:hypothetical protein [Chitinophaga sp. CF418]|uniref:hypothetical protein n=1 Tax=Chitinophaga sp. CF418 TaxID=1855287 RepID=UPI00122C8F66|nr:hypothetical protein [Chitinophaga sp. CF418]